MKEYNRTTKKWEEKEKNGSLKKPEACKGSCMRYYVCSVCGKNKYEEIIR